MARAYSTRRMNPEVTSGPESDGRHLSRANTVSRLRRSGATSGPEDDTRQKASHGKQEASARHTSPESSEAEGKQSRFQDFFSKMRPRGRQRSNSAAGVISTSVATIGQLLSQVSMRRKLKFLRALFTVITPGENSAKNYLAQPGLYRTSPNSDIKEEVCRKLCDGDSVQTIVEFLRGEKGFDNARIAELLAVLSKQILGEGEKFCTLEDLLDAIHIPDGDADFEDKAMVQAAAQKLYDRFDPTRQKLFILLLNHLSQVADAQNRASAGMDASNLGVVFGPNLFKTEDPQTLAFHINTPNKFMAKCIELTDYTSPNHWLNKPEPQQ